MSNPRSAREATPRVRLPGERSEGGRGRQCVIEYSTMFIPSAYPSGEKL